MILLVGGTSETAPLADALLGSGHRVLVSMATDAPLDLPSHPDLSTRRGRLSRDGFVDLIRAQGIVAVVDASHPFAELLHRELSEACARAGVRRIRFERPTLPLADDVDAASDHEQAALLAMALRRPVLLTTGSRHLEPYVRRAREAGVRLHARVLPGEESFRACAEAGLDPHDVEFARGPFTVEQTRALLRRWGIGVLVAKDGGAPSGLEERIEAARLEHVRVVVVRRPDAEVDSVDSAPAILRLLREAPPGPR